jgi:hypothetical protein
MVHKFAEYNYRCKKVQIKTDDGDTRITWQDTRLKVKMATTLSSCSGRREMCCTPSFKTVSIMWHSLNCNLQNTSVKCHLNEDFKRWHWRSVWTPMLVYGAGVAQKVQRLVRVWDHARVTRFPLLENRPDGVWSRPIRVFNGYQVSENVGFRCGLPDFCRLLGCYTA